MELFFLMSIFSFSFFPWAESDAFTNVKKINIEIWNKKQETPEVQGEKQEDEKKKKKSVRNEGLT